MTHQLPSSGSNRKYYRMDGPDGTYIKVVGTDPDENRAFITIARHLREKGINVPEVYDVYENDLSYTQQDLGDNILYDLVSNGRRDGDYSEEEQSLLCRAIAELPAIQFRGAEGLDWSVCFPDREFNARMVDFDLNYFKYCYLKPSRIEFNEVRLQDDFDILKEDLLQDFGQTFMYRDFQARNVIIHDDKPYFIDFQGGRRGPIHYDVASFIWQARARYPAKLKERLIDTYLEALQEFTEIDGKSFRERLRVFVLFRLLQTLGAYGFRGLVEKKPHFVASIPFAIMNIGELLATPFERYPYLCKILKDVTEAFNTGAEAQEDGLLTVSICSFSYKKGIPADHTSNGGGYVFDCRSIPNPGKFERYRNMTGKDQPVIDFIESNGEASTFLESVFNLTDAHIERFLERGFTHLQVCFGCTGGQHRSVYCAEKLASHISEKYAQVSVALTHRERQ